MEARRVRNLAWVQPVLCASSADFGVDIFGLEPFGAKESQFGCQPDLERAQRSLVFCLSASAFREKVFFVKDLELGNS